MPPYKDSKGRWRWRLQHNGKRYSGSTTKANNTRAAAERLEKVTSDKLERQQFTGVVPTVTEFAARFLEYQTGHTSQLTQESQRFHVELHIVPSVLGKLRLDAIGVVHIDQVVLEWKRTAAASTINTRLDTLQRMLALAAEWKFIASAPKIKRLPKADVEEAVRFLTDAEGARLIDAAAPQWRSMILVALRTGLRIGELRGLKWSDVNLDTRSIRVARTDPGRPDMKANSPKSGKGRSVPMTDDVHRRLSELPRTSEWVWPALEYRGLPRKGPRSASGCFHGIRAAVERAGLTEPDPDNLIAWHTLRHTYASALVMRGVSLKTIQELLGHASYKQTEVYAHLAPGFAHHAAVQALDTPLIADPRQLALNAGFGSTGSANDDE